MAVARRVMPGGQMGAYRTPAEPELVIARGRGGRVYDVEGRDYVDLVLGSGPMVIGHSHPHVVASVQAQAAEGSSFMRLTEPTIRLAERLVEVIPCAEQVKFACSGAEATFYALRMARAFTGRDKVLRFEHSYHDHHDYSMVPAGGRGTFLEGLREVTTRSDVLLVFDEMVTGFRLAWGSRQERYGVVPDLACFGKVIAGGHPGSAVAGRADIMALCESSAGDRYVWVSGTLSGNPVSSTAGLATLDVLAQPGAYRRLDQMHDYLRDGLRRIARRLNRPLQVTGEGNVMGLAFSDGDVADPAVIAASDLRALSRLDAELLKRGVLANTSAKLYVSLAHEEADLDRALEAFDSALHAPEEAA
jgi:glutamate-1-semialdehyde 2,1-aminomutase